MLLLLRWHHGTLYNQKWSRTQLFFFLAESWQVQRAHQACSVVLELWGRAESKGEEPVTEVPAADVQYCTFHLEVNLHGLTLQVRSVTVTEVGEEVSTSVTAQNNKAICLNTEQCLGTHV